MMRRAERGQILSSLIFLVAFLAFLGLAYLARHPLLRLVGSFWVVDEPDAHADVMFVLSDDNYAGDRATHAAQLYRRGVAPLIVASGRLLRAYAGIGELIEHDLLADGVPAGSILKFPTRATNTRDEAEAFLGLATAKGWKRILIVTSNYHTRRTRFIYSRVFPSDIAVSVASAPDSEFDPAHWWETRAGLKIFLNEAVGYVVARWELRDGRGRGAPAAVWVFAPPRFLGERLISLLR
jgi:uncharacterized SAM-binding protein YcdF (DUF218 family)